MTAGITRGTESPVALDQSARVRPTTEFLLLGSATLLLLPLLGCYAK